MTVPPWIFQRWMRSAASDPAIKPAKVLYPKLATPQERAQLKARRMRAENKQLAPAVPWGPRRAQGR